VNRRARARRFTAERFTDADIDPAPERTSSTWAEGTKRLFAITRPANTTTPTLHLITSPTE
jgi:hypothetical protein